MYTNWMYEKKIHMWQENDECLIFISAYKREFQKIGNSFKSLATTFNMDSRQSKLLRRVKGPYFLLKKIRILHKFQVWIDKSSSKVSITFQGSEKCFNF